MFIQKGISKDYAENYLKRRMEWDSDVKNYSEDLEYKKNLFSKIWLDINWKTVLDLSSWPWVDTKMFLEMWAEKVICHDKFAEYLNVIKKLNSENLDKIVVHQWEIDDLEYIKDNSLDLLWCNVSFFYSKNDILLLSKIVKKMKKWWFIYISTCWFNKYKHYSNFIKIVTYPLHLLYLVTNYKIVTLAYNNIKKMLNKAEKEKLTLLIHKVWKDKWDINTLIFMK